MTPNIARRIWKLLEPYHAIVYFSRDVKEIYGAAGTKGYWMGYFGSRAAPMGAVGPGVVTATFFGFAPAMVRRAIPDAWTFSTPQRLLTARLDVADRTLRRHLPDVGAPAIAEAADIALHAAGAGDPAGRPLFAANMSLAPPRDPHLRLWHAATCLREHRGDGHIAMLLSSGLDGCEANVLAAAAGAVPRDLQAERRGWTADDWAAATQRLVVRGLLDDRGDPTPGGTAARDAIEAQTDLLAIRPYEALGDDAAQRLITLLEGPVRSLLDADVLPFPNPVGVPRAF